MSEIPDYDSDPLGYLKAQLDGYQAREAAYRQQQEAARQQYARQQAIQHAMRQVAQLEAALKPSERASYAKKLEGIRKSEVKKLMALSPGMTKEQAMQLQGQQEIAFALGELAAQRNPVESVSRLHSAAYQAPSDVSEELLGPTKPKAKDVVESAAEALVRSLSGNEGDEDSEDAQRRVEGMSHEMAFDSTWAEVRPDTKRDLAHKYGEAATADPEVTQAALAVHRSTGTGLDNLAQSLSSSLDGGSE